MNILTILAQFLPILFLVILGAFWGKHGYITAPMLEGIKRIISSISLPALLFLAFSRISIDGRLGALALTVFVSCGLMGFLAFIPAKLFSLPQPTTTLLFQGFEAGMLGYAIISSLYGTGALPDFASVDLGQVLYVFTVLMFQLRRSQVPARAGSNENKLLKITGVDTGGPLSLKMLLKGMIRSPVIRAIVAGLISSALVPSAHGLPWEQGGFLYPLFSTIGSVTTPLISLVVGFGLKDLSVQNLGKSSLLILSRLIAGILIVLGINIVILPALGYGFPQAIALMTLFILPPPFIIPVFKKDDKDKAFISTVLSLHTLIAIVLAFVIALLWANPGNHL